MQNTPHNRAVWVEKVWVCVRFVNGLRRAQIFGWCPFTNKEWLINNNKWACQESGIFPLYLYCSAGMSRSVNSILSFVQNYVYSFEYNSYASSLWLSFFSFFFLSAPSFGFTACNFTDFIHSYHSHQPCFQAQQVADFNPLYTICPAPNSTWTKLETR